MGRDNGDPMNTLKPQPGQYDSYHPKFHPLPGQWAKEQIAMNRPMSASKERSNTLGEASQMMNGSGTSGRHSTEIQRALAAEKAQHDYWEDWQGIKPGKPVYEDPRAFQNTLLPVAKYGTDGRGD